LQITIKATGFLVFYNTRQWTKSKNPVINKISGLKYYFHIL